jgi:hypothetical protein
VVLSILVMSRQPHDLAELRAQYRATSEALDQVHAEELAAMSDEEALKRVHSLKLFVPTSHPSRADSGLVEQQAWFRHARHP